MRSEFLGVFPEIQSDIWQPIFNSEGVPADVYCEFYREISEALRKKPSIEILADVIDSPEQSKAEFEKISSADILGEAALVKFMEEVGVILEDLGGIELFNRYYALLERFVQKYSLRYDLRKPCKLCPTLSGVFTSLLRNLREHSSKDAHLNELMIDFEESFRDLLDDMSDRRIKTVIQKQVNLLEALGASCAGVTASELGKICSEISSWPHATIQKSLSNIYGFTCNYPGIRHGGNPAGAIRPIEMRDIIALSVLLTGFTPYLHSNFDWKAIYSGI